MALAIGDTAPDFEAETTEGKIRFHDWLGNSWGVLFSHPKDFTPVCTTELGTMARLKPEFDKRNTKIIGLSVDPVDNHKKWAVDIKDVVGFAPNYPMIGDTDLKISKAYGMLPASTSGTSEGRTPADNMTVRNVFIIGPDKKIKLILVYPMTTGPQFRRGAARARLAPAHRQAPHGDAGELETRRGRDHDRRHHRRRSQEALSAGLEDAEALYPHRAAAEVTGAARRVISDRTRARVAFPRALFVFGRRSHCNERRSTRRPISQPAFAEFLGIKITDVSPERVTAELPGARGAQQPPRHHAWRRHHGAWRTISAAPPPPPT